MIDAIQTVLNEIGIGFYFIFHGIWWFLKAAYYPIFLVFLGIIGILAGFVIALLIGAKNLVLG